MCPMRRMDEVVPVTTKTLTKSSLPGIWEYGAVKTEETEMLGICNGAECAWWDEKAERCLVHRLVGVIAGRVDE